MWNDCIAYNSHKRPSLIFSEKYKKKKKKNLGDDSYENAKSYFLWKKEKHDLL